MLSNILGSELRIKPPGPMLMDVYRLHGIGEEVYPEGTHLMVPFSLKLADMCSLDSSN